MDKIKTFRSNLGGMFVSLVTRKLELFSSADLMLQGSRQDLF